MNDEPIEHHEGSGEDEAEQPSSDAPPRRTPSQAAPHLAAMMLAVGEIIEPEKTKVEIAIEHSKPVDPDELSLEFGNLPPLD